MQCDQWFSINDLHVISHGHFIYKTPKLGMTQMPIKWEMEKQIHTMAYYSPIQRAKLYNKDESQRCNSERETKTQVCDVRYI